MLLEFHWIFTRILLEMLISYYLNFHFLAGPFGRVPFRFFQCSSFLSLNFWIFPIFHDFPDLVGHFPDLSFQTLSLSAHQDAYKEFPKGSETQSLATGKYGCTEVRVYPAECGEQLGKDPSKIGSSNPLF